MRKIKIQFGIFDCTFYIARCQYCTRILIVVIPSLFSQFSLPGDCEGTFRFSSQAVSYPVSSCPPRKVVDNCSGLLQNAKQGSCEYQYISSLVCSRPEIKPKSIVEMADALSTRLLIIFIRPNTSQK